MKSIRPMIQFYFMFFNTQEEHYWKLSSDEQTKKDIRLYYRFRIDTLVLLKALLINGTFKILHLLTKNLMFINGIGIGENYASNPYNTNSQIPKFINSKF
jgi:hypothetical protein